MWYDKLPDEKAWSRLWYDYTICGRCRGIRAFEGPCAVCSDPPFEIKPQIIRDQTGKEIVVQQTFMGAEGRYEDWIYLRMMEREWKRPIAPDEDLYGLPLDHRPSPRASIVLLFWSYFETRIERLLRAGLAEVPERLLEDNLRRSPPLFHDRPSPERFLPRRL